MHIALYGYEVHGWEKNFLYFALISQLKNYGRYVVICHVHDDWIVSTFIKLHLTVLFVFHYYCIHTSSYVYSSSS